MVVPGAAAFDRPGPCTLAMAQRSPPYACGPMSGLRLRPASFARAMSGVRDGAGKNGHDFNLTHYPRAMRIARNTFMVFSLLLFLAAGGMWVRSYWVFEWWGRYFAKTDAVEQLF